MDQIWTLDRWRRFLEPTFAYSCRPARPEWGRHRLEVLPFRWFIRWRGIKHDFKSRLFELEVLLTPEERQGIVREAQVIFMHCTLVVKEFDDIVAARKSTEPTSIPQLLFKHLLPMGMVVLFQGVQKRPSWTLANSLHFLQVSV